MSNSGVERFSGVGSVDPDVVSDVAFIGGEKGPNSAQQRQNQQNEGDDVAFIGGGQGSDLTKLRQNEHSDNQGGAPCPPPDAFSAGMLPFVEGGTDLLAAHHMPDTGVPPATASYLGGTMLI